MLYARLPDPFPLLGSGKGLARETTLESMWQNEQEYNSVPVHVLRMAVYVAVPLSLVTPRNNKKTHPES